MVTIHGNIFMEFVLYFVVINKKVVFLVCQHHFHYKTMNFNKHWSFTLLEYTIHTKACPLQQKQKFKEKVDRQPPVRFELTTPGLQDQCSNHWAMEACLQGTWQGDTLLCTKLAELQNIGTAALFTVLLLYSARTCSNTQHSWLRLQNFGSYCC